MENNKTFCSVIKTFLIVLLSTQVGHADVFSDQTLYMSGVNEQTNPYAFPLYRNLYYPKVRLSTDPAPKSGVEGFFSELGDALKDAVNQVGNFYKDMGQAFYNQAIKPASMAIYEKALIPIKNEVVALYESLFCDFKVPNIVGDQYWDLGEHLAHGLRVFKLPIHPVKGLAWVTHKMQKREVKEIFDSIRGKFNEMPDVAKKIITSITTPIISAIEDETQDNLWKLDETNIRFLNVLVQLKEFLDKNPNEVITLILNIFTFQEFKSAFLKDFETSGIEKYIYAHTQGQPWPTLRKMITDNKRLVIFTDESWATRITEKPGFHHDSQYFLVNEYGYRNVGELNKDSCPKTKNSSLYNSPSTLFNMAHAITPLIARSAKEAVKANAYDVLKGHVDRCKSTAGIYPNFISLDFVNLRFDDLKKVIDEINSKEW